MPQSFAENVSYNLDLFSAHTILGSHQGAPRTSRLRPGELELRAQEHDQLDLLRFRPRTRRRRRRQPRQVGAHLHGLGGSAAEYDYHLRNYLVGWDKQLSLGCAILPQCNLQHIPYLTPSLEGFLIINRQRTLPLCASKGRLG